MSCLMQFDIRREGREQRERGRVRVSGCDVLRFRGAHAGEEACGVR
jgi:hypothetical protein